MTGDTTSREHSDVRTRRIAPTEIPPEGYDTDAVYAVEQTIVTGKGHDSEVAYEPIVINSTTLEAIKHEHDRRDEMDAIDSADADDRPLWLNDTVLAHYLDPSMVSDLIVDRGEHVVESIRPDSDDADEWTSRDAVVSILPEPFHQFEVAQGTARDSILTPREAEVWHLAKGVGLTRRDTAHVLGIGDNTAKTHLRNAREKREQMKDTRLFFNTVGGDSEGGA